MNSAARGMSLLETSSCCLSSKKKLQTGDLEPVTFSKQEINAEIRDTFACLYPI